MISSMLNFFFLKEEEGMRDLTVTGVQTCALPIWIAPSWWHNYYPDQTDPKEVEWRLVCHIGEFWKQQPAEYRAFGLSFCDVDVKLVRHIDPRLTLERPQTQYSVEGKNNLEYCKFVMRINE